MATHRQVIIHETAVIREMRDAYGLDEDTIMRIVQEYGDEIREASALGMPPFAIANEYQARWASR